MCHVAYCLRSFWCCVAFANLCSSSIGAPTEERRFAKVGHSRILLGRVFALEWKKIIMGSMNYPIFTGKEVPEDWLADYELFMLSMPVVEWVGSSSSSGLGLISPSLSCAVWAKNFGPLKRMQN